MEGNFLQGGMVRGGTSFGGFDLQGSSRVRHHQPPQPSIRDGFPLTMGTAQSEDQAISVADHNKGDKGKIEVISDEDEPSEDGHNDANQGKKGLPWQRVKWTDKMVKLLITAVSYIGEDATSDCSGGSLRRKFHVLQKKGKWKSISKVMAERGHLVSPQQCEDKFNDLNKRYKKLNDMLGRGTSCEVVENPALLDVIDYLTEKEKDDVKKILSSKQLFYEEMCSYLNGNRLHLPHDPALQRSLHLALKNNDDHDNDDFRKNLPDDVDEDDDGMEADDHDVFDENHTSCTDGRGYTKRSKHEQAYVDACFGNSSQEGDKGSHPHFPSPQVDMNQVSSESTKASWLQKQWIESRALQLEEQKVHVQGETLALEKQRFKWQRFCRKRDGELEKLRMENERMKLENERMMLELKRKELGIDFH
ncbi:uncharacterized protein LOC126665621 [Mercurialis annua]|uniref:uncharacterized protein LOC126665621 n=1 Tax=Mercurialis annua TaxID=3986 RepID=UPI00215DEBD0|nr:uncharacterized protein LOC126665621 [Mercurialis annua]